MGDEARSRFLARMKPATFAILGVAGEPVGVAFAVTRRHLLTAHHNLPKGHNRLQVQGVAHTPASASSSSSSGAATSSSSSASPALPFAATLVGGDEELDWAVFRVEQDLQPAPLWKGRLDENKHFGRRVLLFDLGIGSWSEDPDQQVSAGFMVFETLISGIRPNIIVHDAPSFPGDSGSPVLLDEAGHVVAMHIAQVNKVPVTRKRGREGDDELHSSLSSSTAHVGQAVRIDVIRSRIAELCAPEQLVSD